MTIKAPNTVSKLFFFDKRIKGFYEKQGYTSVPFDSIEIQKMIVESNKDLKKLFCNIWGVPRGNHLLDMYRELNGNIHEFFLHLDNHNQQLFTTINW
ncbi:hypothetical protein [Carboxylicivirga sp. N1Y90]|uniref:hypothetical protein n=1 Tax=Carboxylicivirga fragile TaxID=3417571 RepID=UPI003D33F973|nr:hypothetical protein [Marinilabiliaceae bacterium N1Y90]